MTSLHVLIDAPSKHFPDRIEIELHTNPKNLAESTGFSIPLYPGGVPIRRQASDTAGQVDIAVIELNTKAMSQPTVYRAFTPAHLLQKSDRIEVGSSLLVVGFPLGFHDTLHHIPVVRHGIIASSFGLRFQGEGYFLTDGRMHRGTSGSPVVMRAGHNERLLGDLRWKLLGIHSTRLDVSSRDMQLDEALGDQLRVVWRHPADVDHKLNDEIA